MMGLPFSQTHQLGEFPIQWQYFHAVAEEADFLPKSYGQRVMDVGICM